MNVRELIELLESWSHDAEVLVGTSDNSRRGGWSNTIKGELRGNEVFLTGVMEALWPE